MSDVSWARLPAWLAWIFYVLLWLMAHRPVVMTAMRREVLLDAEWYLKDQIAKRERLRATELSNGDRASG